MSSETAAETFVRPPGTDVRPRRGMAVELLGWYLTFVVTTLLLVPEVLELTSSTSPGTIVGMVVNGAGVAYLLFSKRLFGLRGGAPAVRAERDHDVSWAALARHVPDGGPATASG